MRVVRPLLLSIGITLAAATAAAQTRDAGAPSTACAGVTQNQMQVQSVTGLGVTVDAAGVLVVRDPARLTATQRRELAELQALPGARWQGEVDPTTAAALRRQPDDDADSPRARRAAVLLAGHAGRGAPARRHAANGDELRRAAGDVAGAVRAGRRGPVPHRRDGDRSSGVPSAAARAAAGRPVIQRRMAPRDRWWGALGRGG